jgi:hypothetical protein
MSEQLTFYKLFAEKQYNIEIPIIQRDYAQGRKSAVDVRNVFLDALYIYLSEDVPFRDLDFIYGDIDVSMNFIPLDGQQRLTTLFLLHWYLAVKEGKFDEFKLVLAKDGFSKFTYKTRQSAADFCDALLKHTIDLNSLFPQNDDNENTLSQLIQDSSWYFLPWNNDPTVQSMLCMLDAIHIKFKNTNGFYDSLIDTENPTITFQFLELKDYGLTDDLYIKMNSRGKPLTKFENFKAKFEQHLSTFNNELAYKPSLQKYFAHRIDTKWADLFWSFRDRSENIFDKQLMNFISTLAINHYALRQNDPKKYIDSQDNLPLEFYLNQNEEFISTLTEILDLLSENPNYTQYLQDFFYYNEIDTFKSITNNNFSDAGYVERIKFFAYYSFLVKWKTADGFADWMRVIVNLTENTTPYNSETEFINSLRVIQKLLPVSNQIIEHLIKGENISGFNPTQVKEEQIKAHLISKSANWVNKIFEAEEHLYFKGQLSFALAFSGIEEYYDTHLHCNWVEIKDAKYFQSFNHYLNIVLFLFDSNGLKTQVKENHRLHRALLSKGNYLISAKSNLSFLNDSDRDVGWKRFLQGDGERKSKREYFKQLLDDPNFEHQNFNSLDTIASNSLSHLIGWRNKFVASPQLFSYLGNYKYIRFENENVIYLLSGVKMNGEHTELFTYAMYLQLISNIEVTPFKGPFYYTVNTDKDEPCIFLYGFTLNEIEPELDIYHVNNGSYKLKVFDRNKRPFDDEVSSLLLKHGFNFESSFFELIISEAELKSKIESLSKGFLKLSSKDQSQQ